MRAFLLTALLLAAPASAQGTAPASVPVSAPLAPAKVLQLTAPVGATAEFQTVNQSRMTPGKVQVTAAPGRTVSATRLKTFEQQLGRAMGTPEATSMQGKLFVRVARRDADGTVALLTSIVQALPGEKQPLTLRLTQTFAPGGALQNLSMNTDHPVLKAMLAGLSPEKLRQFAEQNGGASASIYGRPLVKGAAQTQTSTVDLQDLLGALIQGMTGQDPQAARALASLKVSPMTVTTTTTYAGLNAQGLHVFTVAGRSGGYTLDLGGLGLGGAQAGQQPSQTLKVELLSLQTSGSSTVRPDGLPGPMNQQTTMQLAMTMQMDDVVVRLPMTMVQSLTAQPR
ncbi:hypothetical protein [Deinococcus hohokamensis]|uniref:Uncharacterized protein n=1 Tax=Deinococcus hohokamensis TaxID=309883 RepID=A0ABV9IA29_9DEIO